MTAEVALEVSGSDTISKHQTPIGEFTVYRNLSELDTLISEEERIEADIQTKYSGTKIIAFPRIRHDSIPKLLDLSESIITLSRGEIGSIESRVRQLVNLDVVSIEGNINNFLSNNRKPDYRNLLNRSGKVLESILGIQNTGNICNWTNVFLKLKDYRSKKAA